MAYRIQIRRDTSSSWSNENPILSQGELGLETDTGKLKIGDGVHAWNDLPYFAGDSGGSSTWTGLEETPDSFTGQAGKGTRVKSDETGLEFVDYLTKEANDINSLTEKNYLLPDDIILIEDSEDGYSKKRITASTIKRFVNYIGDRGVIGGGYDGNDYLYSIEYINILTTDGSSYFGELSTSEYTLAATSNGINDRGIFAGGKDLDNDPISNIEYITISIRGDSTEFGNLTQARGLLAATSNGVNDRGVFGGGNNNDYEYLSLMDYITILTTGNATTFGNLTNDMHSLAGTSNATNDRGIFGGGQPSSHSVNIDYITLSTPGNATYFGDLSSGRDSLAATSNGVNDRGVFGGGNPTTALMDYVTISTTGNATNFGNLTTARGGLSALSNSTGERGVFCGGYYEDYYGGTQVYDTMDYITINSPSNAIDFGSLNSNRKQPASTSNT